MKDNNSPRSLLRSVLLSQAAWLISALVLLIIFCAVSLSMRDPDSVILPLSLCALYMSSVIGGIFAVRLSDNGLLPGLISGIITAAIVFAVSALPFPDSSFEFPRSILPLILIIPASVAGGVIGRKRKKSPAKQRAKMRRMRG